MRPDNSRLDNCLAILRACNKRPRTAKELQRVAGMSRPTFFRTLIDLRETLDARVICEDGEYMVEDWGIIDRSRL